MHLVVGLGNPGPRYAGTRHNVGFELVDGLAARWRIALAAHGELGVLGAGGCGDAQVVLAKPTTFMNTSGPAVAALCRAYAPERVIVASDDLDLPLEWVRVRRGGSAGGHRGVASVIEAIGADFVRLRIGIGRPPAALEPVEFVLAPFAVTERPLVARALARAARAVEIVVGEGVEAAMRAVNGAPAAGAAAG